MILIIEDSKDVNHMLVESLNEAGFDTESAYTGIEGINKARLNKYELILLDIMLPFKSGDEVLREIRTFSEIPVIIISAKDIVGTKIDLLKLGADDYITKPFDLGEVVARVEATLRRFNKSENKIKYYQFKNLKLDDNSKRIFIGEQEIELTSKEYSILEMLIKNQDKVFTKSNIYESVWNEDYLGDDNAVKTHMSNLRSKLRKADKTEEYIETVWGLGYRLCGK